MIKFSILPAVLCALIFVTPIKASNTLAKKKNKKQTTYNYLVYTPQKYDSTSTHNWPLIIYLHGKSAGGNNLDKVKRYGIPYFIDKGMQFEAIVISPQCPTDKKWDTDNWFPAFFKEITCKYHIDTTRIYLTGMSMGGFGCWLLGIKYPTRFACIVPFCGGYFNARAVEILKDVPIWVFHGNIDTQVPIRRSNELVEALRKVGGTPKYTVLKGAGHDIHREFANEQIYKWMYKYRRGDKLLPEDFTGTDTVIWKNGK